MKRDKRRYLLIETTEDIGSDEAFAKSLNREIMGIVGQLHYHEVNPKIVEFIDRRHMIVRVGHSREGDAIAALALIKAVDGVPLGIFTLRSSGTLRALRSHIGEYIDGKRGEPRSGT